MEVILKNLPFMFDGFKITLLLAACGLLGSLILGTILAVLRMSAWRTLNLAIGALIDLMRMIPLIMVIFWIYFLIPILTGHAVTPMAASLAALIVFNSSYMAEIIRAGMAGVPAGLSEAARSGGLTYLQCLTYVVLPQAFKAMVPAMVNRFVTLFMATSLAYTIGVTEFFRAASLVNFRVFKPVEILSFVAMVYFVCCFGLSLLGRWMSHRFSRADKRVGPDGLSVL